MLSLLNYANILYFCGSNFAKRAKIIEKKISQTA